MLSADIFGSILANNLIRKTKILRGRERDKWKDICYDQN